MDTDEAETKNDQLMLNISVGTDAVPAPEIYLISMPVLTIPKNAVSGEAKIIVSIIGVPLG